MRRGRDTHDHDAERQLAERQAAEPVWTETDRLANDIWAAMHVCPVGDIKAVAAYLKVKGWHL